MSELHKIINNARMLGTYRESAREYRAAEASWANQRCYPVPNGDTIAIAHLEHRLDFCDKLHDLRMQLIDAVLQHLPELDTEIPVIRKAGTFHMHGTDWDALEKELLKIEAVAFRQLSKGTSAKSTAAIDPATIRR
jgi:hypothetical protein